MSPSNGPITGRGDTNIDQTPVVIESPNILGPQLCYFTSLTLNLCFSCQTGFSCYRHTTVA